VRLKDAGIVGGWCVTIEDKHEVRVGDLWFIGPSDMLKGRVEPTIWARMASGFARAGWSVRLVSPYAFRKGNLTRRELADYYELPSGVSITILPTPLRANNKTLFYYRMVVGVVCMMFALAWLVRRAVDRRRAKRRLVIYGRGYMAYIPFYLIGKALHGVLDVTFVFETNAINQSRYDRWLLPKMDLVVVNSALLAADLVDMGVARKSMHVAYLASIISGHKTADALRVRQELGTGSRPIVAYTGKVLEEDREIFYDLARLLEGDGIEVVIVGGERRHSDLPNLHFVGFVPPSRVADYQVAADVLLNLVRPERSIFRHITPTKVFDYLAAERPIVTTPFPTMEEILPQEHVELAQPTAESIAQATRRSMTGSASMHRSDHPRDARDQQFSFDHRVTGILEALNRAESR